ncbi:calcium-binding protein [Methylibium sp.]|uniref:calcium-binding protein n=1 Tax=Methylibium sp. TaxID=2067992 RepID=UPI003D1235D4
MPIDLTAADLTQAQALLDQGQVSAMYTYLSERGDRYATLANGVATGNTLSGSAAIEFMRATATQQGKTLSDADIDGIRHDMAEGYLRTLEEIANPDGSVTRDMRFGEAQRLHDTIFNERTLGPDAWTLNTPGQIFGPEGAQQYWERLLDAAGDPAKEAYVAGATHQWIDHMRDFLQPPYNDMAASWSARFTPASVADILLPVIQDYVQTVVDFLNDALSRGWAALQDVIDSAVNTSYRTGLTPPRPPGDPLAIDLDGDGLETVGIGATPILFDHNADGIKTGTGWVKGDDAWLVLDRNGNGTIDSGRELFGVDTLITNPNGSVRTALDGFEALRTLDAGNGTPGSAGDADGVFNASDAAFSQVRLWQDVNQDGISQSSELFSLAQKNITSIGLTPTGAATNLGNGNIITGHSTVTYTNGSTTDVDSVAVSTEASNLDLALNPFYREFTDAVSLTEAAQGLPEMGGSGVVRDLREAMSLGNTASSALVTSVQAFAAGSTRAAQQAALDELLHHWASTEAVADRFDLEPVGQETRRFTVNGSSDTALQAQLNRLIPVLEVFNGMTVDDSGWTAATSTENGQTIRTYAMAPQQATSMLAAYDALSRSVYEGLAVQTRLRPYLDSIELVIDENGVQFDTAALTATLESVKASNEGKAVIDLAELLHYSGGTLSAVGFDGEGTLRGWVDALPAGAPLRTELTAIDVFTGAVTAGTARTDIYFGDGNGNNFSAGGGNDIVDGGAGNDYLYGGAGNDALLGGAGNDYLDGEAGDDTLDGGEGDDALSGGEGSDTYTGGAGVDSIYDWVSTSNDTYRFGRGDGVDNVLDYGGSDRIELGAGIAQADVTLRNNGSSLVLGLDTGETLTVSNMFNGSTGAFNTDSAVETIRFADGSEWDLARMRSESLRTSGAADTVYGSETADTIDGGDGNDSLSSLDGNDALSGDTGNDYLYGGAGNDALLGGAGNDYLDGEAGDDTLDGGEGDDALSGGEGSDTYTGGAGVDSIYDWVSTSNDTYRFGRGDGVDNVLDYGGSDRIELGAGIAETDVTLRNNGSSLVLGLNTGETLTIGSMFNGSTGAFSADYAVETIRFADGSEWNLDRIRLEAVRGTAAADTIFGFDSSDTLDGGVGNDTLYGRSGNDTLLGGAGNDYLDGEAGDDTLDGGEGDDALSGGEGNDTYTGGTGNDNLYDWNSTSNDTYRFGRGDGVDNVLDYGGSDRIELGAGIAETDVTLRNNGSSLVLGLNTGETLTIGSMFNGSTGAFSADYAVETIRFADGSEWNLDRIRLEAVRGTAAADTIFGFDSSDTLDGGVGNDTLYGRSGNDTLLGGAGNDYLDGEAGDDTLDGGEGDDALSGGEGNDTYTGGTGNDNLYDWNSTSNDTYRFGRGDGVDNVLDYGGSDRIELGAGIAETDVTLRNNGSSLVVGLNTGETLTVGSMFNGTTGALNPDYATETIRFADGSEWDLARMRLEAVRGTAAADTIFGFDSSDTLDGGVGNDTLYGRSGNDTLLGGAGNDYLDGEAGDDTLDGGEGDDALSGGEGNDTYTGGTGNDNLYDWNSTSNDTYRFGRGDGVDNVLDYGGSADRIELGAGIAETDVTLRNNGSSLVVGLNTGETLTVGSMFNGTTGALNPDYATETIRFADGSEWDLARMRLEAVRGTAAADTIFGFDGNDALDGGVGNDTLYGLSGNDTLLGGVGNDYLDGGAGDDALDGGEGDDALSGGEGNDTYTGGTGNDNLYDWNSTSNDTYRFGRGDGVDNVLDYGGSADRIELGAGIAETDVTLRNNGSSLVVGLNTGETLTVGSMFNGTTGALNPDYATETIRFADGSEWDLARMRLEAVRGTAAADTIFGFDGSDALDGGVGNDTLYGLNGNDALSGGTGDDSLFGGEGNDVFVVDSLLDSVYESANQGTDTVQSTVTWALGAEVENLTLTGTAAVNGTGNALANVLTGNSAANMLDGGSGADALIGGAGNDTYWVDHSGDVITELTSEGTDGVNSSVGYTLAANVENLTLTGSSVINATGNTSNNVLTGNSAANVLTGGAGNDTYVVGTGDTVTEAAGAGTDTVSSSITWSLGANLENLTLTGTSAINGTGNALDNVLTGNSAANVLTGGAGNDTYVVGTGDTVTEAASAGTDTVSSSIAWTLGSNLENLTLTGTSAVNGTGNALDNVLTGNSAANVLTGGAGNDTYVVGTGDTVTEAASAGTDTVQSSITWALGNNLENLTLTGTSAINGTGNTLANVLTGNTAANTLDGGSGADTLVGGAGNDSYVVDNTADVVTELAAGGTDGVSSSVTYTLSANVENLTLTGSTAINGTGNASDNALTGNSAANVLSGGTGNDTYVVGTGDTVTEAASAGTDTVSSSIAWTLGNNLENLTLTGSSAINGTGNALDNVLTGNSAANVLTGGAGNDTYVVGTGDTVTEAAGAGTDTVQSSITWTLGNDFENLALTGTGVINGTGNTLGNVLTGNSANNTLTGNAGNDTLDGGAGTDTLAGGTGNDSYVLGRGYGADTVQENDTTAGNTDVLQFLSGVSTEQIWLRQVSNNLEISIIGTSDKATLTNWYLGSQYHVEQFKTSDGKTLLDSQVQNLVSAMAGFTPPAAGQTTLPPNYQTALAPVIAANWNG